jgi:hypothetical protein
MYFISPSNDQECALGEESRQQIDWQDVLPPVDQSANGQVSGFKIHAGSKRCSNNKRICKKLNNRQPKDCIFAAARSNPRIGS